MAETTKTYSFSDYTLIIGGVTISGIAQEGFSITFPDKKWTEKKGANDTVVMQKMNANKTALLTINLLQSSPSNKVLSGFDQLAEAVGSYPVTVYVKNNQNLTTFVCANAYISQIADWDLQTGEQNAVWELICPFGAPFWDGYPDAVAGA